MCDIENRCGEGANCISNQQNYTCLCKDGRFGDPYLGCELSECIASKDCPMTLECLNRKCVDPCHRLDCASDAECIVTDHLPACRCKVGYIGDPIRLCRQPSIKSCSKDSDCPDLLACFNGKCEDPCAFLQPCGIGAKCHVFEKLSWVAMTCTCPEGYDGEAFDTCRPGKYC